MFEPFGLYNEWTGCLAELLLLHGAGSGEAPAAAVGVEVGPSKIF